jgi:hypothetical protein
MDAGSGSIAIQRGREIEGVQGRMTVVTLPGAVKSPGGGGAGASSVSSAR